MMTIRSSGLHVNVKTKTNNLQLLQPTTTTVHNYNSLQPRQSTTTTVYNYYSLQLLQPTTTTAHNEYNLVNYVTELMKSRSRSYPPFSSRIKYLERPRLWISNRRSLLRNLMISLSLSLFRRPECRDHPRLLNFARKHSLI